MLNLTSPEDTRELVGNGITNQASRAIISSGFDEKSHCSNNVQHRHRGVGRFRQTRSWLAPSTESSSLVGPNLSRVFLCTPSRCAATERVHANSACLIPAWASQRCSAR